MRLLSITVRNYRVHRDITVALDPARTLIGGPNEAGKSTLAEAVHRALFFRAKTGGEFKKGIDSRHGAGHPEVELVFEAGGRQFQLAKRFSGPSGSTLLTERGGSTWHDDEAETRLAKILAVDPPVGGKGGGKAALGQWSHLWVFQGKAGEDPVEHANAQKDSLITRLQQIGGAAVMQSELDARVAAFFKARREEWFTKQGDTARKDSDLGRAVDEEERAESAWHAALQTLQKLESAILDHQTACETLEIEQSELAKVETDLAGVEERAAQIVRLRGEEKEQAVEAGRITQRHEEMLAIDAEIVRLRDEVRKIHETLAPRQTEVEQLRLRHEETSRKEREAGVAWREAEGAVRDARLALDLARAQVAFHEKLLWRDQCRSRHDQAQAFKGELAAMEERLAGLPQADAETLTKLRQASAEADRAEAAFQAVAATVELVAADLEVRLGEQVLAAGASRVITEDTEITLGRSVRLRIRPGGGAGVREAEDRMLRARQALQSELDHLGLPSIAAAVEIAALRQQLHSDIKALNARLVELRSEEIEEALARAGRDFSSAEAELERRLGLVAGAVRATTPEEARESAYAAERRLERIETVDGAARAVFDQAAAEVRLAVEALSEGREALQREKDTLTVGQTQFDLLRRTHGDDATRAAKLEISAADLHAASVALQVTREALVALQPDLVEGERLRLDRSMKMRRASIESATTLRDQSRGILQSDGILDPREQVALAEARLREARSHRELVERRGRAISLLHRLFVEEQRALSARFTQPLAERIGGYLQCLFGAGARAGVILGEGNNFAGIELVRPGASGGAMSFDVLSGGAREQVAAAFRLAIAEILAEGHDRCLPVVFDDAFAYSDPERVRTLQRMLDLAAQRGLQIIVLTCNPADYAALGARETRLPAPGFVPPAEDTPRP